MEPINHVEWWRPIPKQLARDGVVGGEGVTTGPVAFRSLMVLMGIVMLAPQAIFPALAPLRIALLTAGVAIGAHVFECSSAGRPIIFVTREMRIAVALLSWALLTIPFSLWPGGSVALFTDQFLKALVLFGLIANTVVTMARFRQFAWGISLMTAPIAATAIMNYKHLGGSQRISGYEGGLTSNPNDLALTLNIVMPFILVLVGLTRRPVLRTVLLACVGLNIIAVILTFSRGGFITLAVILAVTVAKLLWSRKRALGVAFLAISLLCLPLLPRSYWHRLTTIADIDSDETGSAQARRWSTFASFRFVLTHPVVGAGIGSDIQALNQENSSSWHAVHNVYLQYAVDLGLPGVALFLALFATCLAAASTALTGIERGRKAWELGQLAHATRLSLIAFGVAGLFHPVAYNFYFYYLAGLASACGQMAKRVRMVEKIAS